MKNEITLYALSTCVHCKNTKKLLDECHADYDCCYVDTLEGEERTNTIEKLKVLNPRLSFLTLCIGDTIIVGYKEDKIKEALDI